MTQSPFAQTVMTEEVHVLSFRQLFLISHKLDLNIYRVTAFFENRKKNWVQVWNAKTKICNNNSCIPSILKDILLLWGSLRISNVSALFSVACHALYLYFKRLSFIINIMTRVFFQLGDFKYNNFTVNGMKE